MSAGASRAERVESSYDDKYGPPAPSPLGRGLGEEAGLEDAPGLMPPGGALAALAGAAGEALQVRLAKCDHLALMALTARRAPRNAPIFQLTAEEREQLFDAELLKGLERAPLPCAPRPSGMER